MFTLIIIRVGLGYTVTSATGGGKSLSTTDNQRTGGASGGGTEDLESMSAKWRPCTGGAFIASLRLRCGLSVPGEREAGASVGCA